MYCCVIVFTACVVFNELHYCMLFMLNYSPPPRPRGRAYCSYIFGLSVLSGQSSRLYFHIYLSILSVPWHLVSLKCSFNCRYSLVATCPNSLLCNTYTYVGPLRFIYSLQDQSINQCLHWMVSVKYPCLDVQVVFIYGNIFLEIHSALTVVAATVKYR